MLSKVILNVNGSDLMAEDCLCINNNGLKFCESFERGLVHRGMACKLAEPPYTPKCSRGYGSKGSGW